MVPVYPAGTCRCYEETTTVAVSPPHADAVSFFRAFHRPTSSIQCTCPRGFVILEKVHVCKVCLCDSRLHKVITATNIPDKSTKLAPPGSH